MNDSDKLTSVIQGYRDSILEQTPFYSIKEVRSAILNVFKELVPEEYPPHGEIESEEATGFNNCREAILANIERLRR